MTKRKSLKIAGDLFYTVMATVVMNVALQIVIFPLTTRLFGEGVTGNILYFIGLIYIIPQAFGTALNNTRLVSRKEHDISNGDFSLIIWIMSTIAALSCGVIAFFESFDLFFSLAYGIFSVIYMLRIYAQVEFRLELKFKEYLLYYILISIGYLIGFGLFVLTEIWLLIFVVGEVIGLGYNLIRGKIFRKEDLTENRGFVTKTAFIVVWSVLIRDCVIQFDKIILGQAISSQVVTQYHAVSLIAKTIQMLTQPINTLILTYLTAKDSCLTKKKLVKFSLAALLFGVGFYGVCVVGTPIFVRIFYPTLYDAIMPYNLLVNLGLIVGFVSSMFLALLLSQGKTVIYTAIEIVCGVCYIAVAYCFVNLYEIWGLIIVTLIMNLIKLGSAIIVLFTMKQKNKKSNEFD